MTAMVTMPLCWRNENNMIKGELPPEKGCRDFYEM